MRLFLDANVLFTAAHNPSGKAALVIELGKEGYFALATSLYASEEARRNLERKFPQSSGRLDSLLRSIPLVPHPPDLPFPPTLAGKDRPIFQAAVAWDATHLLTGDPKDFGPFMNRPEETSGHRRANGCGVLAIPSAMNPGRPTAADARLAPARSSFTLAPRLAEHSRVTACRNNGRRRAGET